MKRYPTYREAGIPWLAVLPLHWDTARSDRLFHIRREAPLDGDEVVTAFIDGTVTLRRNVKETGLKNALLEQGWQRIYTGDVAISGMNAHLGGIGVSDSTGKCSPVYLVLVPTQNVNARYLSHVLRLCAHSGFLRSVVQTIRFNSADLNADDLKLLRVPCPPRTEQDVIVAFLDRKLAEIDRFIAAKDRLITLLKEQKAAIVNRAVTYGLDPDAPGKSSGIGCLGEIPAEWRKLPLKRCVRTKITDGPHETPEFLDAGVDFVSAEAMQNGRIDFNRRRGFISHELHELYCRKCRPMRDDIFMCKSGATTGKVVIVDTNHEFSVWSPLALIRVDRRMVLPHFMFLTLQAEYVQQQVQTNWSYGTQPNIAMSDIERLYVALPPLNAQQAILEHVGQATTKIVDAVERAEREIELIREFRTSLIADAVTGKVDVRAAIVEEVPV